MPKQDKQKQGDAPQADAFDDFAIVAGGSATRFDATVAARIVAFLTAKAQDVKQAVAAGQLVALPVTIATEDLKATADNGRSLKGNTAYDYLEVVKAAGIEDLNVGTKWREDGDVIRLHLGKPRKQASK